MPAVGPAPTIDTPVISLEIPALKRMAEKRQWVCWHYEPRDDKPPTKVPYSPHGGPASVTDASTWASHEAAVAACCESDHTGVGFILAALLSSLAERRRGDVDVEDADKVAGTTTR